MAGNDNCQQSDPIVKAEGLMANQKIKKTYRIYREESLQVRSPGSEKRVATAEGRGSSCQAADRTKSELIDGLDIGSTGDGKRFPILNIVDDYSRECVGQIVYVFVTGQRVSWLLDRLALGHGRSEALTVDDGAAFRGKTMSLWCRRIAMELWHIQPGKPIQNLVVESFSGEFRGVCL